MALLRHPRRHEVAVVVLVLCLLHATHGLTCSNNLGDHGNILQPGPNPASIISCEEPGLKHCYRLTFLDPSSAQEISHIRGCNFLPEAVLQCLRQDQGLAGEGNCFKPKIDKGAWDKAVATCVSNVGANPPKGPAVNYTIPDPHFMELCICNEADMCNEQECKCEASHGLCGADHCEKYKCYCAGVSPTNAQLFPGQECSFEGLRTCVGVEKTGCYTLAQEGTEKLYKDCALPLKMVDCIHGKMTAGSGSEEDCVTGTNADWYKAAQGCGWKDPYGGNRQLPNEDREARIKACRCTKQFCNRDSDLTWKEKKPINIGGGSFPQGGGKDKSGAGRLEQGIWALGAAMMVMAVAARI